MSIQLSNHDVPLHILHDVFQYLTIADISHLAMASKGFKALVYQDRIWKEKLKIMLDNDHGLLSKLLGKLKLYQIYQFSYCCKKKQDESNVYRSVIPLENILDENKQPLTINSNNPFRALKQTTNSSEFSREQFKQLYIQLFPFYSDLRDNTKESTKILREYKNSPGKCGQLVNLLIGLGECQIVEDYIEVYIKRGWDLG